MLHAEMPLPHKSSLAAWKLYFFTTHFNGIGFSATNFTKPAFERDRERRERFIHIFSRLMVLSPNSSILPLNTSTLIVKPI
jgi:hypothetical protein